MEAERAGMEEARAAVLRSSAAPALQPVRGYAWEGWGAGGGGYEALLESYLHSGFQASALGEAVLEVRRMLAAREEAAEAVEEEQQEDEFARRRHACTIFLGYTSNVMSSGLRETLLFLVRHALVDCVVASAGGVEEDLIKCLAPTLLGDWTAAGRDLRRRGLNRIGNLLVPNDNYCKFETWATPLLDEMLEEQTRDGVSWTPSKVIARLGERIADERSVYYWAWKNKIPVFSPALTDGSLGDVMYFHSYRNPGLIIDILADLRRINSIAVKAKNTGMIILGGGLVKHHICNANLMRNGADYAVFINTGTEYDGSDAGASPDEAVSWGKIRPEATPVKVYAEATLVFPLLVAQTFAKYHFETQGKDKKTD